MLKLFVAICPKESCLYAGYSRISRIKDFARIQQPMRVKRALKAAHDIDGFHSQLLHQRPLLAKADTVFTLKESC